MPQLVSGWQSCAKETSFFIKLGVLKIGEQPVKTSNTTSMKNPGVFLFDIPASWLLC